MKKQEKKQMDNVSEALSNLSLCLKLALHDKDTFIRQYGYQMYGALCSIAAETSINECNIYDILHS